MANRNEEFEAEYARHLSPNLKTLYHGSPEEFQPGDIIHPANKVGKIASNRGDVAYATPELATAYWMAWEQNNHNGNNFSEKYGDDNPPPRHVYEVEPVNPASTTTPRTHSGMALTPDWKNRFGGYRGQSESTSPDGFRVISKVQHSKVLTTEMKRRSSRKKDSAWNAGHLLRKAARVSANTNPDLSKLLENAAYYHGNAVDAARREQGSY